MELVYTRVNGDGQVSVFRVRRSRKGKMFVALVPVYTDGKLTYRDEVSRCPIRLGIRVNEYLVAVGWQLSEEL